MLKTQGQWVAFQGCYLGKYKYKYVKDTYFEVFSSSCIANPLGCSCSFQGAEMIPGNLDLCSSQLVHGYAASSVSADEEPSTGDVCR